jgi:hypothetical protein
VKNGLLSLVRREKNYSKLFLAFVTRNRKSGAISLVRLRSLPRGEGKCAPQKIRPAGILTAFQLKIRNLVVHSN